jgi:hypothetical protein
LDAIRALKETMKNTILISATLLLGSLLIWVNATDVVVFPRSTGYPYPTPVPKTGQTTSYATGDDGDLEAGIAWPATRFTVQANTNCVLDNLTGLIWARNANQFGKVTWSNALSSCNNLNYGGQTDWRLPNWQELRSLIDAGNYVPTLPTGHPFAAVASDDYYWSSTTLVDYTSDAWCASLSRGYINTSSKVTTYYYAWPVRGP